MYVCVCMYIYLELLLVQTVLMFIIYVNDLNPLGQDSVLKCVGSIVARMSRHLKIKGGYTVYFFASRSL